MSGRQELHSFFEQRLVQMFALTLLLTVLGGISIVTVHSVHDPDVWWHLKVGDWILLNHQVPHSGILSRTAAERPWVAYSWGYEVQLSLFYAWFGLLGIGLNGLALTMLVITAVLWSTQRLSQNLWASVSLTAFGCGSFLYLLMPRPVFFSMALFAVLITFLLESQRTGQVRLLYWLPPIFCLWANLHIQFVYGLFVLGLFVFVRSVQQFAESRFGRLSFVESPNALPPGRLWAIFGACLVAGCVGPYGPRLYQVVWEYSHAKYTYTMIIELFSPRFDAPNYYLELFVAATAFFALGWRKRIDVFKLILLAVAVVLAFRTERDAWFLCMVSVAFIAAALRQDKEKVNSAYFRLRELGIVTTTVCFALFLVATNSDFTARGFDRAAGSIYPINAANFLRQNRLPGPMFNSFDWGGFLTWYMPQYPVSLDGRNDLYGDELDQRLYQVEGGEAPYEKEQVFMESQVILLENDVPLAKLLSMDPAYRAVYRDRIAVVFIRQQGGQQLN